MIYRSAVSNEISVPVCTITLDYAEQVAYSVYMCPHAYCDPDLDNSRGGQIIAT